MRSGARLDFYLPVTLERPFDDDPGKSVQNEHIASVCAAQPDRLRGLAMSHCNIRSYPSNSSRTVSRNSVCVGWRYLPR